MTLRRRDFLGLIGAAVVSRPVLAGDQTPTVALFKSASQRSDPWLEISEGNLVWNLRQIQARVGQKPVMAVIKANAYGHGLVNVARALVKAGVSDFLVGKLGETRQLRAAGIRGRILNFGPYADADAEEIVRLDVSQNVYTDQVAILDRAARRLGRRVSVQVKVDTGLGRLGVPHDRAVEFLERVAAMRNVRIEGVFTTLTEDAEFDPVQLARLKEVCEAGAQRGHTLGRHHAASSAAICDFPAAFEQLDMVRPGIMLYGLYPSERAEKERILDLKPALTLKARVAYVKALRPGESVSYHRAFIAAQPERVATLPVGYSDGFSRALAGKGAVLIAGRRCPILAISANATIVRLGDTPAAVSDEVVLIGSQGTQTVSASEVATLTGGSVYGIAIGLSGLLPQVFV